jgi:CubicO group peptidase (beta-lactamase class C family)
MISLRGTSHDALDSAVLRIMGLPDAPPGVCVAASAAGGWHWSAGGVAQQFNDNGPLLDPAPMDLHTRTDVGSITKIIATTLTLMALVDSGTLDLAAPVREVLPRMSDRPAGYATLGALLQHRSGLWEWLPTYLKSGDPLDIATALPLRYPPDAGRHYSDLGFLLLGAVISAATEEPLADAVTRFVLRPLGLTETAFGAPVAGSAVAASSLGDRIEREMVRSRVPYPVAVDDAGFAWREHVLVGEINDGNAYHSFGSVAGHAGLFSTAADLLTVGDALLACLAGRGHLSAGIVNRFFQPGDDPLQALGFRIWQFDSGIALGHTGFPGVAMAVDPHRQLSIALVTNRLHVHGTPTTTDTMWTEVLTATSAQGGAPWQ